MAREPTQRRADFSRGSTTADHRGHQLRGGRLLGRLVENDTTVELRNGAVFGADGQLCRHGVVITGTLISRWASRQRRRSGRGRSMPRASRSCPGSSMHPPHAVSRLRPEQRAGQPFMTSRQALRALRAGIRRSARWVAIVGWALLCAQRSSPAGCAALGCCTEHTSSKRLEEVVQREPVAAERLSMPGFVLTPGRPGERSVDRQPTTTSRPAHFEDSHDLGLTWGRFSDLPHRLPNGAPAGAP